jgi:hypothetical protein
MKHIFYIYTDKGTEKAYNKSTVPVGHPIRYPDGNNYCKLTEWQIFQKGIQTMTVSHCKLVEI